VEPDRRRLVEDVEHADEPGADLRREPDALALTARERRGLAVERDVPKPTSSMKPSRERISLKISVAIVVSRSFSAPSIPSKCSRASAIDISFTSVIAVSATRTCRDCFLPGSLALGAGRHGHVLLDVVAGALGVGLDVAALQVRDDALEALGLLAGAVFRGPLEVNQIVGAVEELPLNRLVQLLEGGRKRDAEVVGDVVELAGVVGAVVAPRFEDVFQGLRGVVDHEPLVDFLRRARSLHTPDRHRTGC